MFPTNAAGKTGYLHAKNGIDPTLFIKINPKWIKDLNYRNKTIKFIFVPWSKSS